MAIRDLDRVCPGSTAALLAGLFLVLGGPTALRGQSPAVLATPPGESTTAPRELFYRARALEAEDRADGQRSRQAAEEALAEAVELEREAERLAGRLSRLQSYRQQVERQVARHEEELLEQEEQLARVTGTRRRVLPLLGRMVTTLGELLERDLPFLLEARRDRLESLRALLDEPGVPLAERYRRVMETYRVELGYGRTMEAWRDRRPGPGDGPVVDLLRLGRVALYARRLDGGAAWIWSPGCDGWRELSPEQARGLPRALRVATSRAPPDLVELTVPAPRSVQATRGPSTPPEDLTPPEDPAGSRDPAPSDGLSERGTP